MIHSVIALACADDPEALMEPVAQLAAPPDEAAADVVLDELEPLPHAASSSTPVIAVAARAAVRVIFTLILRKSRNC